jgi:hypothetical protein
VVIACLLVVLDLTRTARSGVRAGVEATREVLGGVEAVARAFRTGTIETSFLSYATEVSGTSYLQFASLDQVEVFERKDSAALLWGQLQLPEVVVQATAPIQYTYYLDLDEEWSFELREDDRLLLVTAPNIRHNRPAIDASRLHYEVRADSLLRDESVALDNLRRGITEMAERRAVSNRELVREIGRRKTEQFIENWLFRDFGQEARTYHVDVRFADETDHGLEPRPGLVIEPPDETP